MKSFRLWLQSWVAGSKHYQGSAWVRLPFWLQATLAMVGFWIFCFAVIVLVAFIVPAR